MCVAPNGAEGQAAGEDGSATPPAPARAAVMTAGVYLAHFDARYRHAGHYIGWAEDIEARAAKHARGTGGRLMAVIKGAGIGFVIARTWPGESRTFERRLKNRKNAPRECPVCQGRPWPEVTPAPPVEAEDLADAYGPPF